MFRPGASSRTISGFVPRERVKPSAVIPYMVWAHCSRSGGTRIHRSSGSILQGLPPTCTCAFVVIGETD